MQSLRDLLPAASARTKLGQIVRATDVLRTVNVYLDQRLLDTQRHDAHAQGYRDGVVIVACRVMPALLLLRREEAFLRTYLSQHLPHVPVKRIVFQLSHPHKDEYLASEQEIDPVVE